MKQERLLEALFQKGITAQIGARALSYGKVCVKQFNWECSLGAGVRDQGEPHQEAGTVELTTGRGSWLLESRGPSQVWSYEMYVSTAHLQKVRGEAFIGFLSPID